jgi:glycosyltransferase involved in cell wall biosynthesis
MPVYNAAAYVGAAIQSILAQEHDAFELLIVDDASTDGSLDVVRSFRDPRIHVLHNESNLKLAHALNRGLAEAKGDLIARMDSDDVARPDRLVRQEDFMRRAPDTGASGSWVSVFGVGRRFVLPYLCRPDSVAAFALFDSPVCHPSVILRRSVLQQHALCFDPGFNPSEDYDLWERLLRVSRMANLNAVLLDYRVHARSMTRSDWGRMDMMGGQIVERQFQRHGVVLTADALAFHRRLSVGAGLSDAEELQRAERWLTELAGHRGLREAFPNQGIEEAVGLVWFRACLNTMSRASAAWGIYRRSSLRRHYRPLWAEMSTMLLRSMAGLARYRGGG